MKKQSFMTGAIILMIANAISKILGAVFKIPLTYIIGEEGMAVYNTAFNIYIMFLSFIISGLPFSVSKLVSEYSSRNEHSMVRYTVKKSNMILCIIGLVGSVALFFGAEFFALAMKEEKAVFAIKMISPSIFLVAAGTSIRSYYQGISNMIPTAISQVIESVVKLVAGYYLAMHFIDRGISFSSGGAVMGVTVGEAIATAVFVGIYLFEKKEKSKPCLEEKRRMWSSLFDIALPLMFASVVSSMLSVVDTTVIRSGLIEYTADVDTARKIYGAYTGYALTLFHLPIGIFATLCVSILPVIAGSIAVGNHERTKTASFKAVHMTILFAAPCAVLIYFMSGEVLGILFHNTSSAEMLKMTAPCLVMICVANIITAILQSAGKIMRTFLYSAVGMVIKLVLSVILIKDYGIYGAIISANISYFVVMILNILGIRKIIGLKLNAAETIIKPSAAVMIMCLIIYLIKIPIEGLINSLIVRTALICTAAIFGYMLMLLLTGALNSGGKLLQKNGNNDIITDRKKYTLK